MRILPLVLAMTTITPAHAETWSGMRTTVDGVEHVSNPATPMQDGVTIHLNEAWRIGGETDNEKELFGVVWRIATDDSGQVYVLDRQLSEVRVFDRDHGRYLRTVGREGEGPGEFRRPTDMFFLSGRDLAVVQVFPPRIEILSREGVPTGELPFPKHDGPQMLRRMIPVSDRFALARRVQQYNETSYTIYETIDLMDREGTVLSTLESHTFEMGFASFKLREQDFDVFQSRFAVGPNSRIYTCPTRRGYTINVWSTDGALTRVIEREYESHRRSAKEHDRVQRLWDAYGRTNENATAEVDDYDKDIAKIYPRPDGTLWALTSQGVREKPAGSLGVFDVLDADGRFLRQLTLVGEGDPVEDSYFFTADRLFVVTKVLEADAASRGGAQPDEDEEEPTPTEIICYELGPDLTAHRE